MFHIYGVVVINGEKHRHFLGNRQTLEESKHLANCATCGNADYAYVKDFQGDTVFFLKKEGPGV